MARKIAVPGTPVRRTASTTFTRSAMAQSYLRLRTTTVESVPHHSERLFEQREARQGVSIGRVFCRFAEDPQDLSNLGLSEPNFDLRHEPALSGRRAHCCCDA